MTKRKQTNTDTHTLTLPIMIKENSLKTTIAIPKQHR